MAVQLTRTWRFLKELTRVSRWRLGLSAAAGLAVSLTENVGILLLLPLLGMAGIGRESVNWSLPFKPTLESVLMFYVSLVAVRSLLAWFLGAWNNRIEQRFLHKLRERLFHAAGETPWVLWLRERPSHFLNAMTVEMERTGEAVHLFLSMLCSSLLTAGYTVLAFLFSWKLASFVLAFSALLWVALKNGIKNTAKDGDQISEANDNFLQSAKDYLDGIKLIRSNGTEQQNLDLMVGVSKKLKSAHQRSGERFARLRFYGEVITVLVLAATVFTWFKFFHLPPAHLLLFLFLFSRLLPRLSSLQQDFNEFTSRLSSFSTIQRKTRITAESKPGQPRYVDSRWPLAKEMRLEHVYFGYDTATGPVLKDINLSIAAHDVTLITGASGSGKTTLVDLVSSLLFPGKGNIFIDDVSLTTANASKWRQNISVVPQEAFLFNDTLFHNLLWASPKATRKDMAQALDKANVWDFVNSLPQGLDTPVGERGLRFSGGQRQRIVLARALLRNPSLLILDEPTYALDAENEEIIASVLLDLRREMAVLCMMHRIPESLSLCTRYEIREGYIQNTNFYAKINSFDKI